MRTSFVAAALAAIGAGTVGVGALDSVPNLYGTASTKSLTTAVINACGAKCKGVSGGLSGSYGITFQFDGGSGESINGFPDEMMEGPSANQGIAPMSRPMTQGICFESNRSGAEGLVVALETVGVVVNSNTVGAEGIDYTGATAGNTGNDWRNVLRQIYAGMPTGQNNIHLRDCNSATRRGIISSWDSVFHGTVNACADSHPSVPGTAPNRYDQNDLIQESGVRHAFRRDEESGTTDVFLNLLQLPTVNFSANGPVDTNTVANAVYRALANSPFCNVYRPEDDYQPTGLAANVGLGFNASRIPEMSQIGLPPSFGAGTGLAPQYPNSQNPRNLAPYLPAFMDQDPVRRTCVGSIGNQITAYNTNLPFEQVCNADGKLGVVLPISPPPGLAMAAAYPTLACDAALGFVAGPAVLRANSQAVRCPNGDIAIDGRCLLPVRANGTGGVAFDCLNGKNAPPAVTDFDGNGSVFSDAPATDGRTDVDGRVYNLILRDAAGNPLSVTQPDPSVPIRGFQIPLAGAFYRIHSTRSLLLPPNATLATSLCRRSEAAAQIGCLTVASPCSIGYAGHAAAASTSGVAEASVNGVQWTTTAVQNLVTGGGPRYPFSRKSYVNSLRGFGNLNANSTHPDVDPSKDAETELVKAFASLLFDGTIDVTDQAFELVPLPGGAAYCEDYDGSKTSNCSDGSNTDACQDNPPGIPKSSCSNGVQDGDETAIDTCPAARSHCVAGVCSP